VKSRSSFYIDLSFQEVVLSNDMSLYLKLIKLALPAESGHVKDWIDNTMIFLEVDDVNRYWNELLGLNLPQIRSACVKLTPV